MTSKPETDNEVPGGDKRKAATGLQNFAFPEYGINVDAPDLETAQKMAEKHPDRVYSE